MSLHAIKKFSQYLGVIIIATALIIPVEVRFDTITADADRKEFRNERMKTAHAASVSCARSFGSGSITCENKRNKRTQKTSRSVRSERYSKRSAPAVQPEETKEEKVEIIQPPVTEEPKPLPKVIEEPEEIKQPKVVEEPAQEEEQQGDSEEETIDEVPPPPPVEEAPEEELEETEDSIPAEEEPPVIEEEPEVIEEEETPQEDPAEEETTEEVVEETPETVEEAPEEVPEAPVEEEMQETEEETEEESEEESVEEEPEVVEEETTDDVPPPPPPPAFEEEEDVVEEEEEEVIVELPTMPGSTPVVDDEVAQLGLQWGAYAGWRESDIVEFEDVFNNDFELLATFAHWGNNKDFPFHLGKFAKDKGRTLIIFWETTDYNLSGTNHAQWSYDAVLSGMYDDYIREFAADARAYGGPVILIPFSEMNGNWFTWGYGTNGNTAAKGAAAYRHVHDVFGDVSNVKWGWAPNAHSVPNVPDNQHELYYPGDDYVDYVGLDGFNFGSPWMSFDEIFGTALKKLEAYNKPMYIFSMASAEGPQKAAWMRDAFEQMQKYPSLQGFVWFNENKERDWRIWSDVESYGALVDAVID